MNLPEQCPFCGNRRVAKGSFHTGEAYAGLFLADDLQFAGWRKFLGALPTVPVDKEAKACLHCGGVWGHLDLGHLHKAISRWGSDELKDLALPRPPAEPLAS
jgi:hypothetical protein